MSHVQSGSGSEAYVDTWKSIGSRTVIRTTEMHSAGEPVRIIESGYPEILGKTVLEKRRYAREHLDHLRKFVMFEPRGHYDMYGALIVKPDLPEADFGVLFMHNEGYSTMCGHATIALARYAVDRGLVSSPPRSPRPGGEMDKRDASPPRAGDSEAEGEKMEERVGAMEEAEGGGRGEIQVNIECPCGLVRAWVECDDDGKTTGVSRFYSVPAFAFALDVSVEVAGVGYVNVDIGYGGAFYAVVTDSLLKVDVKRTTTAELVRVGAAVSKAVRASVQLTHPDSEDLAYLYGTIITDGKDEFSSEPTANLTIFANNEVDRAPTGSGVTARIAIQYARGLILPGQRREFESAANESRYTGKVVEVLDPLMGRPGSGDEGQTSLHHPAVVVEVGGTAYYTGEASFTAEDGDDLRHGFLLK